MSKKYWLSTIFGVAAATVIKKPDNSWTLQIELYKKDDMQKASKYLTHSGHRTRKAALDSWASLNTCVEVQLYELDKRST